WRVFSGLLAELACIGRALFARALFARRFLTLFGLRGVGFAFGFGVDGLRITFFGRGRRLVFLPIAADDGQGEHESEGRWNPDEHRTATLVKAYSGVNRDFRRGSEDPRATVPGTRRAFLGAEISESSSPLGSWTSVRTVFLSPVKDLGAFAFPRRRVAETRRIALPMR